MSSKKNNWYVITGTLSSGKTTLINGIKDRGYFTIPEQARVYIDAELDKGRSIQEIRANELLFQQKVLQTKVELEKGLDKNNLTFFDRGVHDSIAYYKLLGINNDGLLSSAVATSDYVRVFLLDMLEYTEDYARVETQEERSNIHELLYDAYIESGIEVVRVPAFNTKDDRVEFVLSHIGK